VRGGKGEGGRGGDSPGGAREGSPAPTPAPRRPSRGPPRARRGVRFEVSYAPALRGPFSRRNLVVNCRALLRGSRGRGCVVSGGTAGLMEIRAPGDVVAVCTLLGIGKGDARAGMTRESAATLARGLRRRAGTFRDAVEARVVPATDEA